MTLFGGELVPLPSLFPLVITCSILLSPMLLSRLSISRFLDPGLITPSLSKIYFPRLWAQRQRMESHLWRMCKGLGKGRSRAGGCVIPPLQPGGLFIRPSAPSTLQSAAESISAGNQTTPTTRRLTPACTRWASPCQLCVQTSFHRTSLCLCFLTWLGCLFLSWRRRSSSYSTYFRKRVCDN